MNKANELRLVAAEIIRRLWAAGESTQLELLMMQAKRSLDEPYSEMPDETKKLFHDKEML